MKVHFTAQQTARQTDRNKQTAGTADKLAEVRLHIANFNQRWKIVKLTQFHMDHQKYLIIEWHTNFTFFDILSGKLKNKTNVQTAMKRNAKTKHKRNTYFRNKQNDILKSLNICMLTRPNVYYLLTV